MKIVRLAVLLAILLALVSVAGSQEAQAKPVVPADIIIYPDCSQPVQEIWACSEGNGNPCTNPEVKQWPLWGDTWACGATVTLSNGVVLNWGQNFGWVPCVMVGGGILERGILHSGDNPWMDRIRWDERCHRGNIPIEIKFKYHTQREP